MRSTGLPHAPKGLSCAAILLCDLRPRAAKCVRSPPDLRLGCGAPLTSLRRAIFFSRTYPKIPLKTHTYFHVSFSLRIRVAALKGQHKNERDKRICDRIKAVLLSDKGWSYLEIASVLLLDDQTIFNHVQEYKMQKKLTCNHKGSEGKLNRPLSKLRFC